MTRSLSTAAVVQAELITTIEQNKLKITHLPIHAEIQIIEK
jgi:hypothetical protein